ncbi:hypothetical protein [Burkholderia gladioli]|uniref:hypothetical protein n=1 Tax=Burkholderia gladioli TaxID=28095 RepID=UPI00164229A0|nr:hypothetical protein [Burkholderia gladioli]
MSNPITFIEPDADDPMFAALEGIDADLGLATAAPVDAPAAPVAEQVDAPSTPAAPAVVEVPAAATVEPAPAAAAPATPTDPTQSPNIQALIKARVVLLDASTTVWRMIKGEGNPASGGLEVILNGLDRAFSSSRVMLGAVLDVPSEKRLDAIKRLEEDTVGKAYALMREGKVLQSPQFLAFEPAYKAMMDAHKAWLDARIAAQKEIGALSSQRGNVDAAIPRRTSLPDIFSDARDEGEKLSERIQAIEQEQLLLGRLSKALATKDLSALDDWKNSDGSAPSIAAPVVATAAAAPAAPAASDPPKPMLSAPEDAQAAPEVPEEPVVLMLPTRKDAVEPVLTAEPAASPVNVTRVGGNLVDVDTGEILDDVQSSVEPQRSEPVARQDLDVDRGEDRLDFAADAPADADPLADPVYDEDSLDHLAPPPVDRVTPISSVTAEVGPMVVPPTPHAETEKRGFDPVAFAHKHFYALAGGAAVLVLGITFAIGHQHRAPPAPVPSTPVVAPTVPVAAPSVAPTPAPAPAPVPAPVASVPAAVPPHAASAAPVVPAPAPVVTPPVVTPAPVATTPAATPAPVQQPAPETKPVPVKPAVKPEVRKPARPIVHEHVTTMQDTEQALARLRAKLGE